jgi:flagellar hook-associated protein 2
MVGNINTSGISVGDDGKVRISGFASSIDTKAIIDAAMAAKRIPAIKLEAKITANTTKAGVFNDLKSKVAALTTALDKLRGSNSFFSDNVFQNKTASGSTAAGPLADPGYTPSAIGDLLTVSVQKTAQVATHTITINQLAKAHQLRSESFSSTTTAITTLGVTAGDFELNGQTINIDADDTLLDLRSKINSANAGVTATIVSANATTHYLVLTSTSTGTDNAIDFDIGSATSDSVGFTTNVPDPGTVKYQLQEALNAELEVNGISGIVRSSNEINDIIEGVTLSLLKAEEDTTITMKVEPDLVGIKSAVNDFVTAYNEIRDFYTAQRTASDLNNDGVVNDTEFGPLAYDSTLRQIIDRMGLLNATTIPGNTDGYQSLGQVGVTVGSNYKLTMDETIFDSKLLTDVDSFRKLFAFEFTSSDSRLTYLSRTDATQSGTYYLNVGGTDGSGNLVSANIRTTAGSGSGGANDGSVDVSGKQATIASGSDAEGLVLFFNGSAGLGAIDDISVTFSRGLADTFYDFFENMSETSGTLDVAVQDLGNTNDTYQTEIDTIDARLETIRRTMELKFVRMETALAQLETLKNSISSYFDAQNSE